MSTPEFAGQGKEVVYKNWRRRERRGERERAQNHRTGIPSSLPYNWVKVHRSLAAFKRGILQVVHSRGRKILGIISEFCLPHRLVSIHSPSVSLCITFSEEILTRPLSQAY